MRDVESPDPPSTRAGSFPGTAALPLVCSGTAAAGAGYLAALLPGPSPVWAAYALSFGIGALLSGLLILGARREGRISPRLAWLFLATGTWVAGGLVLLLALPGSGGGDAALFLGLPARAAFLLLGIGLVPGLVIPLAYALVFDGDTLSEDDLRRLRETAERVREARDGNGAG